METTKPKVLIFVPTFPVLSETFIQREIEKLAATAASFDVQVLSLSPSETTLPNNTSLNVLYQRVTLKDILKGFTELDFNEFAQLIKTSLGNKQRNPLSSIYLLVKSVGYAHIIKNLHVSHIHAHFLSESSSLMYFVACLLKLPFSISAHARDVFAKSDDVTKVPELVMEKAQKASFIVVCNIKAWEKCRELVGETYQSKVLLHYHGLDPLALPKKTPKSSDTNVINVISVGRLVEKKGFAYLIEAADLLKKASIPIKISIIGPGDGYQSLTNQIQKLSVGDTVSILGGGKGMPNHEVLDYMSKADIFVLPSIETAEGDAEGIPNTLVEAAFLELPIITTKTGSIRDFVENEQTGILIDPQNSSQIAEAIQKLVANPELVKNLQSQALAKAKVMFDMNLTINELVKLFSENLASN